jgi:vesicle-associated membrane protein 72
MFVCTAVGIHVQVVGPWLCQYLASDKPSCLPLQAEKFQKTGRQLRNKFWWQNCKMKAVLALAVILLAVVIFLLACFTGDKNCTKRNGRR